MYLIGIKVLTAIAFIACTHLILKNYGPEELGYFSRITTISMILGTMMGFGSGQYLFSRMADKCRDSNDGNHEFARLIAQIFFVAFILIVASYLFKNRDGLIISLAALQYSLSELAVWRCRINRKSIAKNVALTWISLSAYLFLILCVISSSDGNIRNFYAIGYALACAPLFYYLIKNRCSGDVFQLIKGEFGERIGIMCSALFGTLYITVPIVLATILSSELDPYIYFVLRLKGYFFIPLYALEVCQIAEYRKWLLRGDIEEFKYRYKRNGFIYMALMTLVAYAFYQHGEIMLNYIYHGAPPSLHKYIIFYMISFSVFGVINIPASLLVLSGHSKKVIVIFSISLIPTILVESFTLNHYPNAIVEIDMFIFLAIFAVVQRWEYMSLIRKKENE